MRRTRLLLAAMPRMLGDIVRSQIEDRPDLVIVGELAELDGLPEAVARTRPDLVLVSAGQGTLPRECRRLMYRYPRMQAMSVSPDGQEAAVYRLLPHRMAVRDVSPAGIEQAIRSLGGPRARFWL